MKVCETSKTRITWSWPEKDHPVWGLTKTLIQAAILALVLSSTSTRFDSGEVKAIATAFLSHLLLEGVNAKRKKE